MLPPSSHRPRSPRRAAAWFNAEPDPKAHYNFTAPDSGIMKAGNGQHFEQSYNAQAGVDAALFIAGARRSTAANDKQELPATAAAISPVAVSRSGRS